jgi:drug/metabolite transporter (DMT)-like permease
MRLDDSRAHLRSHRWARLRFDRIRAQLHPGAGLAIVMVVLSSLLYSLGYAITKSLIETWHFDAMQLFVLRSLLVLAGLAALPLVGRRPPSIERLLHPPQAMTQRAAATALVCSAVLAMIGYGYLPVTTATAFSFTTPLLVTAMAAIFLGERVPPLRWCAVALGFAGVLVIVHPGGNHFGGAHLIGVAAAFGSAALYALQQMLLRRARDTTTTMDVVAQAALVGLILLGAFMPFVWKPVPLAAVSLIVLATVTQTGGLLTIAAAIRMGEVSKLAPWQYGGMVWAILLDLFMFGHAPAKAALIGAGMIVAAGLLSQLRLPALRNRVRPRMP